MVRCMQDGLSVLNLLLVAAYPEIRDVSKKNKKKQRAQLSAVS